MWKEDILRELQIAKNYNKKIPISLKKLINLLLEGDTPFCLVYSSSRENYTSILFRNKITRKTSKILLKNGYKRLFLNLIKNDINYVWSS